MNTDWAQKLAASLTAASLNADNARFEDDNAQIVSDLRCAAQAFAARRDSFAEGKSTTCLDIAAKVERFGSFASDKQRDFALKLITWSKPRNIEPRVSAGELVRRLEVPKLFGVMQKHSHFYADPLKLSRRNQDSLCWILWNNVPVGKIENAAVTLFQRKLDVAGVLACRVQELLAEFDADPLEAAMKYGKLSGRCCSCGRDLTNPVSIEQGIGPVCAQRFS